MRFARSRPLALLAAAGLVGATLALAAPAGAATLTVCASGCDHTTINAAVAAASANDEITVAAGTYAGEQGIVVDKPLTITGAGPGETIVDGSGTVGGSIPGIFRVLPREDRGAGDIVISGMTLRNPGRTSAAGVTFAISVAAQRTTTTIDTVRFDDLDVRANVVVPPTNPANTFSYGIYADSAGEGRTAPALEVTDSTFSEQTLNAVGVDGWRGAVTISGNDLREGTRGNSSLLVFNEYAAARITQPVVVRDNTSAGRLLAMRNITNNDTLRSRGGFDDVTILDNDVTGLTDSDYAVLVGTVPQINPADGNDAIKMGEIDITGNSVRGDGTSVDTSGFRIDGQVESTTITGNDVVGVGAGVDVRTDGAETGALGPDSVVVRSNRLFANERGVDNSSTATVDAAQNWWGCQTDPAEESEFCSEARTTGGPITTAPWVVATAAADDTEVEVGADTEIEVALDTLSDGEPAELPDLFAGLFTRWSAEEGDVDPATGELDAALTHRTTYTAPDTEGEDTVTVVVDEEEFTPVPDPIPLVELAAFGDAVVQGEPLELDLTIVAADPVDPDPTDPDPTDPETDVEGDGLGLGDDDGTDVEAGDGTLDGDGAGEGGGGGFLPEAGAPRILTLMAFAALLLATGVATMRRSRRA